ncbi:MAG: SpoVG family protein [Planctomycetota bacterium]|nr:SpoVG family protein [Planctomycetota bacterium]
MEITEVRISPVGGRDDKLRAFCSVTFDDCFVVRDIRLIEGNKGLFIAMPSRKLTLRCPRCHYKNVVRSMYCNECGNSIPRALSDEIEQGRTKLHADIAHPILTSFREVIQEEVLDAYEEHIDGLEEHEPHGQKQREMVHASGADEPPRGHSTDRQSDDSDEANENDAPRPGRQQGGAADDESDDGFEPESTTEADFLRKGDPAEDIADDSTVDSDSSDMPPPDDNFSSGLF